VRAACMAFMKGRLGSSSVHAIFTWSMWAWASPRMLANGLMHGLTRMHTLTHERARTYTFTRTHRGRGAHMHRHKHANTCACK